MTMSEMDRATLQQLVEHGDNPAIPRPVVHYFYGDGEALEIVADLLEAQGWSDIELAKGPEEFRLIATTVSGLDDPAFEAMTADVTRAIARLEELTGSQIEYDGWETSVEKRN